MENDFLSTRVIAIARGLSGEALGKAASALYTGGIKLTEVTMNSAHALNSIYELRTQYEGKMHIGAGTVTNLPEAKEAIAAGAEFIITPNINQSVIEYCMDKDILIMPGALTPTEIAMAIQCGCKYIKIFPVSTMGPEYIKELSAPFQKVKFIAVGGITLSNAASYLEKGAFGLGVGGYLCNVPENEDYGMIADNASKLLTILNHIK